MKVDGLFAYEIAAGAPEDYLIKLRRVGDRYFSGEIAKPDAVDELMKWFDAHGLKVNKSGGVDDWTSVEHMYSIMEDYFSMRSGERDFARDVESSTVLAAFPARRLVLLYETDTDRTRNWSERWQAACEAVNYVGCSRTEAAALKGSPVWQALGNGAGGYEDWLGNPFPPFAFSSGIFWEQMREEDAIAAGLKVKRIIVRDPEAAADFKRAMQKIGKKKLEKLLKDMKN